MVRSGLHGYRACRRHGTPSDVDVDLETRRPGTDCEVPWDDMGDAPPAKCAAALDDEVPTLKPASHVRHDVGTSVLSMLSMPILCQ